MDDKTNNKQTRRKYVPPRVMKLDDISIAIGACVPGSGIQGACKVGSYANANCGNGNVATPNCNNGFSHLQDYGNTNVDE